MPQFSNSDKQEHGKMQNLHWNQFCLNVKIMLTSKKL